MACTYRLVIVLAPLHAEALRASYAHAQHKGYLAGGFACHRRLLAIPCVEHQLAQHAPAKHSSWRRGLRVAALFADIPYESCVPKGVR